MNTEASLHLNVLQYGGRGISYPSWDQHFRGFSAGDDHQLVPKTPPCHEALYCHWCLHIHYGRLQRCEADGWSDGNQLECPQGLSGSRKV